MEKEVFLSVRVDSALRDAFQAAAKSNDRTAAQLVRDFMRDYVAQHGQSDMVAGTEKKPVKARAATRRARP